MDYEALAKIEDLLLFDKRLLRKTFTGTTPAALNSNISRWIKQGKLIRIKNGLYALKYIVDRYRTVPGFYEYIATAIKFPSYLTSTYVLAKNQMLTDVTYGFTSFTLKSSTTYDTSLGKFSYSKVRKPLFTGYTIDYFLNRKIYTATKAKALFDYLYTKLPILPDTTRNINLVEELRLNLDTFSAADRTELKNWLTAIKSPKMTRIINNIIRNAPNS